MRFLFASRTVVEHCCGNSPFLVAGVHEPVNEERFGGILIIAMPCL